jgi:RNA polymerase sigma-70 factor (ECF subfamily)
MTRPAAGAVAERPEWRALSDEEVVRRVREGDTPLFEVLMRRYNQRLYRVARGILRDDAEAEDVMQHAYVEVTSTSASSKAARPSRRGSRR